MPQRPQQLARRLARRGFRVIYCNLTQQYGRPLEAQEANLWICHDFEALKRRPLSNVILWISWGRHHRLFGHWRALLNVFDSLDDFESWEEDDRTAARRADLVLATSRILYERWATTRPGVHLVPNGCDFEHFHQALQVGRLAEPPDMQPLPRPRAIYMGAMASWLDADAIGAMVEAHPQVTFVFIGAFMGYEPPRRSNVHYLGLKPYHELPRYLAHSDLALIPFRPCRVTRAANPIKLYEYLAAGLPVLATRLPELEPYAETVHLAQDPREFAAMLPAALADTHPERRAARVAVAAANTWDRRADQVAALLQEALRLRRPGLTRSPVAEREASGAPFRGSEAVRAPDGWFIKRF